MLPYLPAALNKGTNLLPLIYLFFKGPRAELGPTTQIEARSEPRARQAQAFFESSHEPNFHL